MWLASNESRIFNTDLCRGQHTYHDGDAKSRRLDRKSGVTCYDGHVVRRVDVVHRKLVHQQNTSGSRVNAEQTGRPSFRFQGVDDVSVLAGVGVHCPDLHSASDLDIWTGIDLALQCHSSMTNYFSAVANNVKLVYTGVGCCIWHDDEWTQASFQCTNVTSDIGPTQGFFEGGGINLTQVIYLPGCELIALAFLSLWDIMHDNSADRPINPIKGLYIGWQWRNFFISYLCQLFFCHVVGQALQSVSYSDITFFVR